MEIMKQESCENELQFHVDTNDDQSWSTTILKTPTIPFSNFYITKGPSSNCSGSHHKLSEQLTNPSSTNNDDTIFEFDIMDIPIHKPRLERSQIYRNVRVSHVDEHLSFVYIMLNEDWLAATRMLNDTFQQTILDKQPTIDILTLKTDGYYMCKSQSSWFRCRLLTKINLITNEDNLVNVYLIDWGMERQVLLSDIREMPQSLSRQSICCVQCRLSGINNVSLANITTLASCHQLLNYHDYEMRVLANDLIILNHNNENINDQIINLLNQTYDMRKEEYLEDEFRHQTILNIGDENWAILASYRGDDNQNNDFYVLMCDKTTNDVDKALAAIDYHQYNVKEPRSIHPLCVKPRMMVIAPWKHGKGDGEEITGYYRAWIRSIEGEKCRIVFVDYGNECDIERSNLLSCPSSVSCLPWLAIRVRFQQYLSHEEFKRFWYRTDSHWIKIKVNRIHNTHYTIQVFIDYTSVILSEDRKIKIHSKDKLPKSISQDLNKLNDDLKHEEPRLIRDDVSSLILYEIRKKLNQLSDRFDENEKKNDERYTQLIEQLQHD
ncbi:unnamed protein product [Adineta steineri]|uniref:Tudor domain-containing protein n=1 Tax=Adineta steineri TaxID=433720 RepID=A0A815EGA5_9BILA|nr:unnamed protein product [Adineta steineri]CAF3591054.1 unnamed protein product [Adineta steineri]